MNDLLPALRDLGSGRSDARPSLAVSVGPATVHANTNVDNPEATLAINQRTIILFGCARGAVTLGQRWVSS